jgi:allantoinase
MADVSADEISSARVRVSQPWYHWSPLPHRPSVTLPQGARVAVAFVIDLRAVEWELERKLVVVAPPGGRGMGPVPDLPRMSDREFGHRVGIFRLMKIFAALGVRPAAAVDVLTAEQYPALTARVVPGLGEILAGGLSANRPITSLMTQAEERHYIESTLKRLEDALGVRPVGWLGPEHSESFRTPALLADAGLGYVADWGNDELPYAMPGAGPNFWSFPLSWELSDLSAVHLRTVPPATYAASLSDAFEVLCNEAQPGARILAVHLHPWVAGRPSLAAALAPSLQGIVSDPRAWVATPAEIIAWIRP